MYDASDLSNMIPSERIATTRIGKNPYDIRIDFMNRGFILQVGCNRLAFQDADELGECVKAYLKNSEKIISSVEKYGIEQTIDGILNGEF